MGYSIASWYRPPGGELSPPDELAERYAGLALGTVGATLAGAECTHETPPGSTAQVASPPIGRPDEVHPPRTITDTGLRGHPVLLPPNRIARGKDSLCRP